MRCDVNWCDLIRHDMSLYVMWCDVTWWNVMWRGLTWCDVVWRDVLWCDVVCWDVMWHDMTWCGVTPGRDATSCDVMWCVGTWCDAHSDAISHCLTSWLRTKMSWTLHEWHLRNRPERSSAFQKIWRKKRKSRKLSAQQTCRFQLQPNAKSLFSG